MSTRNHLKSSARAYIIRVDCVLFVFDFDIYLYRYVTFDGHFDFVIYDMNDYLRLFILD